MSSCLIKHLRITSPFKEELCVIILKGIVCCVLLAHMASYKLKKQNSYSLLVFCASETSSCTQRYKAGIRTLTILRSSDPTNYITVPHTKLHVSEKHIACIFSVEEDKSRHQTNKRQGEISPKFRSFTELHGFIIQKLMLFSI
jgi:hypothetical protein